MYIPVAVLSGVELLDPLTCITKGGVATLLCLMISRRSEFIPSMVSRRLTRGLLPGKNKEGGGRREGEGNKTSFKGHTLNTFNSINIYRIAV